MSTLFEVAAKHQRARARVSDAAVADALRWWYRIDASRLDAGWDAVAQGMVEAVSAAQVAVAEQAAPYVARAIGREAAEVAPLAFSGVVQDGRELGPAMYGAVTTTKRLVGAGRPVRDAFQVGAAFLATVVGSAVQDMGRQADIVSAVGSGVTGYIRVLSPGACSRCAVLAGKHSARVAFKRHPRCQCQAWPVKLSNPTIPDGLFLSPEEYFASLSAAEQDRIFTVAGAEAIRRGADPIQVVNARRGAYGIGYNGRGNVPTSGNRLRPVTIGVRPDGSPLRVYATTEGVTSRGRFGRAELDAGAESVRAGRYRRSTTVRLMPEQIAVMAGDDPLRWIELLRRYGYLY